MPFFPTRGPGSRKGYQGPGIMANGRAKPTLTKFPIPGKGRPAGLRSDK